MPQGHKSGRKTIMTRLMPLGHNPSTCLMTQGHKVRVYGNTHQIDEYPIFLSTLNRYSPEKEDFFQKLLFNENVKIFTKTIKRFSIYI